MDPTVDPLAARSPRAERRFRRRPGPHRVRKIARSKHGQFGSSCGQAARQATRRRDAVKSGLPRRQTVGRAVFPGSAHNRSCPLPKRLKSPLRAVPRGRKSRSAPRGAREALLGVRERPCSRCPIGLARPPRMREDPLARSGQGRPGCPFRARKNHALLSAGSMAKTGESGFGSQRTPCHTIAAKKSTFR